MQIARRTVNLFIFVDGTGIFCSNCPRLFTSAPLVVSDSLTLARPSAGTSLCAIRRRQKPRGRAFIRYRRHSNGQSLYRDQRTQRKRKQRSVPPLKAQLQSFVTLLNQKRKEKGKKNSLPSFPAETHPPASFLGAS